MQNKKKNIKRNNIIQLILGIVIIILLNVIGAYLFTRVDLTSEKRYSLSDATREMLGEVDDIVFFRVYLEGDFPAGFQRLRNATKEMLDEFRAYNDNIHYEFINPSESENQKERNETYQLLVESGLNPTDLQVKTNEGMSQKIIFPGALVTYRSKEIPLELLRTQVGVPPEQVLNNSIQALEFNLANSIQKLSRPMKASIAFITGHGELSAERTADLMNTLALDYNVERVPIKGQINSLAERTAVDSLTTRIRNKYDAIIIAKPDSAFTDRDKFIIDQYIMRGGNVLWFIDPVFASMDSIQNQESTVGVAMDMNLQDLFFRYGVRLNRNLVMDLNAMPIPVVVGQMGDQPQYEFFPWYYFPLLNPTSDHPIVKNLNAIKTQFVSSIDTIKKPGIKKTVLLKTSPYSRTVRTPAFISLRMIQEEPNERQYGGPAQNVAMLLEGSFESLFRNRMPPEIAEDKDIGFLESGEPAKMLVVSDGDIIKNQMRQGFPLPLGYDQYTQRTFGNKEFILNALSYMIDESNLISVRGKEIKLRMLDKTRVNNNKILVQLLNTVVPVLIILIFWIIQYFLRKRKYTRSWTKK